MEEGWYRIADLEGIPGMPKSHDTITRTAKKLGWETKRAMSVTSNGQKREATFYRPKSLPKETTDYLLMVARQKEAQERFLPAILPQAGQSRMDMPGQEIVNELAFVMRSLIPMDAPECTIHALVVSALAAALGDRFCLSELRMAPVVVFD